MENRKSVFFDFIFIFTFYHRIHSIVLNCPALQWFILVVIPMFSWPYWKAHLSRRLHNRQMKKQKWLKLVYYTVPHTWEKIYFEHRKELSFRWNTFVGRFLKYFSQFRLSCLLYILFSTSVYISLYYTLSFRFSRCYRMLQQQKCFLQRI